MMIILGFYEVWVWYKVRGWPTDSDHMVFPITASLLRVMLNVIRADKVA